MPLGEPPHWTEGCPPLLLLADYSLGKLPTAVVERVATHLSGCKHCETLLHDRPEEEDSLIENLRRCAWGGRTTGDPEQATPGSQATIPDVNALCGAAVAGLPARLGQYELLELLGRGGMGVVYKARQVPLKRVVAVKLALGGPVPGTEAFARFQVESEAIARLQHDNIVRVYECGEHNGRPYFSMDYVEGGSLAQKLSGTPLSEREAASLVQTLARAVQFAHRHQIIHRDLKPANVLIDADGAVKLTDFGLAKLTDAEDGQTQGDAVIGTASYMAPEQARGGTREVGPLADVYGLGAILYETLTGRPPFKGANREETLKRVQSQEPLAPSRLRPGLSRDLEAVCLKCLAKDPKQRYASAEELAKDLARWRRGEPTKARPRRWPARVYRTARKHPVGVLLGALILCAPVMLSLRDPERPVQQTDPDQPVKEIETMLAQGQPVSLIGETGRPAWFRWALGEESTQVSLAEDETFSVHSWGFCLLELVRDPQQDRYRLRARVRHEESDSLGEVGVYLAHRAYPGSQADIHVFTQLTFNDVRGNLDVQKRLPEVFLKKTPPPKDNLVALHPYILCAGKGDAIWYHPVTGVEGAPFKPAGVSGGPWHELEVIVTPEELRATWDGRLVGAMSITTVVDHMGEALTKRRELCPDDPFVKRIPSDFPLRGSLGLYVIRGSAHFRSVRIELLTNSR
jgi:eukaryotic-like serine/threonine-protein kinase